MVYWLFLKGGGGGKENKLIENKYVERKEY